MLRISFALCISYFASGSRSRSPQIEGERKLEAALFREAGDDDNYGETVLALADLQFKSGDLMQAVATFEVGLEHIHNPSQRQAVANRERPTY